MPRARAKCDSDGECYRVWDIIGKCDLVWDIIRNLFGSFHAVFDCDEHELGFINSLFIRHDDFIDDVHSFIFRNFNADDNTVKRDERSISSRSRV